VQAFAELNDDGDRILVHIRYDEATKNAVKGVPGAMFVPTERRAIRVRPRSISARNREKRDGEGFVMARSCSGVKAVKSARSLAAADDVPRRADSPQLKKCGGSAPYRR
jgi:hypothetical protein